MNSNQPMFKLLFRDELYTLEDVMRAAERNPDVLWVVYEANGKGKPGSWSHHGTMTTSTIMSKFG